MAKTTSYFHPDEPNADSLLGRLSICPLGAESIGFTTKYKAVARLHGPLINYKRLDNLLFQMYRQRNIINSGTFGLIYRQSNFR